MAFFSRTEKPSENITAFIFDEYERVNRSHCRGLRKKGLWQQFKKNKFPDMFYRSEEQLPRNFLFSTWEFWRERTYFPGKWILPLRQQNYNFLLRGALRLNCRYLLQPFTIWPPGFESNLKDRKKNI